MSQLSVDVSLSLISASQYYIFASLRSSLFKLGACNTQYSKLHALNWTFTMLLSSVGLIIAAADNCFYLCESFSWFFYNYLINWLAYKMLESNEKCLFVVSRGDVLRSLVLSNQQSTPKNYLVYNNNKQRSKKFSHFSSWTGKCWWYFGLTNDLTASKLIVSKAETISQLVNWLINRKTKEK